MALALYRKYRPATFAAVVGQEHVTGPLMTAVDSGRINHAYLFSGPRGCGKTSSARILARSLNCEQGPTSNPCGACQSCIDLAPDGSGNIDVIEIDAASHGGVDDARELRERAFQLPVSSRYKIYIIDEAHMVSNQGFNALLKVVEEPPESVVFIFATTEPDKVLPTIRSRTHHYPFRLVPPAAMRDLLERNCVSEGVQVGPAVLPLVVRAGGGSVRDSQSLLDQLIAGAGPGGITYEEALALLGVTDAALLDDMVEAIGVADGATVFGTVNRLIDAGHDPRRFGADLLDRLRDLILMAAVPDAGQKGLIDAPEDHVERLADQASRLGLSTLSRLADIVHVGLTEMRGTTSPRLGLELICARMLLPAVGDDGASMTQRIERLERRMDIGGLPPVEAGGRAPGRATPGGPGAAHSGSARREASAAGLSPRQRAEAELAAQRGSHPGTPAAQRGSEPGAPAASGEPAAAPSSSGAATAPPAEKPTARPAAPAPDDESAMSATASGDAQADSDGTARQQSTPIPATPTQTSGTTPTTATTTSATASSASPTQTSDTTPTTSATMSATATSATTSATAPAVTAPSGAGPSGATPRRVTTQQAAGAQAPAHRGATQPVPDADSGWPEVKAPGSGRTKSAAPAAEPAAATAQPAPSPLDPTSPAAGQAAPAATAPTPGAPSASEPAAAGSMPSDHPEPSSEDRPAREQPQEQAAAGNSPQGPTGFDIAEVRRQWRSVVDVIKRSSRATAALVETATPVTVRGDTLVITMPPALVRRLADPQQHQPLKAALQDVLGVTWLIEVSDPIAQPAGGPEQGGAESAPPDDDAFTGDPDDESVADPRAGLDPGQAAVNLLRDELGAEEIVEQ